MKYITFIIGIIVGMSALSVSAQTLRVLTTPQGGTGASSFTSAGVIYGNGTGALLVTPACNNGQIIKYSGGIPACGTDSTGGGGGSFPFDEDTNYSQLTYSTTTLITFYAGIAASSTSHFVSFDFTRATGTSATTTNLFTTNASTSNFWTNLGNTLASFSSAGKLQSTTVSSPLSFTGSTLSIDTSGAWSGNAGTASALFANGANCSSGNAPLGVDASGAVESCFDVWTEAENTSAAYTPQSTTITIAGTANQITSSAGAQDLSTNRTWTLSIPADFRVSSTTLGTNTLLTSATTTNFGILNGLTFNGVTSNTWAGFCTTITGSADLCDGGDATGGGGGEFPFTVRSYGVSTSTTVGFLAGLFSVSSTTVDGNLLVTGNATATNATTTALHVSNNLSFGGVSGTAWSNFCTSITGGAGLCDGSDDGGASAYDAWTHPVTSPFTSATTSNMLFSGSTTLQNFTGLLSTTSQATTTALAITGNAANCSTTLQTTATGGVFCGSAPAASAGGSNGQFQYNNSTSLGGMSGTFFDNAKVTLGIGTSTPQWLLQLASSTAPQLVLSDASLTSDHWFFRNAGGMLYIGTSSASTFASTSKAVLTLANTAQGTSTLAGSIESLGFTVDSGSNTTAYTTGYKGFIEVPYDAEIIGWTALGTTTNSATTATTTIDVWKDTYANFPPTSADSIFTSTKVGIYGQSGAVSAKSTSTPATTRITEGDIISFYVDSNQNFKRVTVIIKVKRR